MHDFDVIIAGAGPGGSTMAALLCQAGKSVAIFEKESFPRFHIGESLLPYSMDVLQEIGIWDELDDKYIRKYGAQFVDYRGDNEIYFEFKNALETNHPMAYEVPRDQFDQDLLTHARSKGSKVFQPHTVEKVVYGDEAVTVCSTAGDFTCKFFVDATGRDTLMGKYKSMKEPHADLNNTAVFAHFEGITRVEGKTEGDIIIGILPQNSWSWFIPFKGDRTSVGVVSHSSNFRPYRQNPEKFLLSMLKASSVLTQRMQNSQRISNVGVVANYSFKCTDLVGKRWILIGDAGAFLDPVFSSGVHLAVNSAKFAAEHLVTALEQDRDLSFAKAAYESKIRVGMSRFKFIIDLFYTKDFIQDMTRVISRDQSRKAFTSVLAGDVWNEENPIFKLYDMNKFSNTVRAQ